MQPDLARSAPPSVQIDRKSTRLNSSHLVISYAVFCLKKKNKHADSNYDGHSSIAMELHEGQSLDHTLFGLPLPLTRMPDHIIQVTEPLEALHVTGLVH